jgi:hypothetical protein
MTVLITIPTGRPKRDIIELAFDDCGMAGYEFDRTPEEQTMALRKLNALMLEWPWNLLGYNQPDYGVGLAEGPSGLPDEAISGTAQYLAMRIAPGIGNTISPELKATMARALANIEALTATVQTIEPAPGTAVGTGNRYGYGFTEQRYT